MKKILLVATLSLGFAASALADGYFVLSNDPVYNGTANSYLPYINPGARTDEGTPGVIIGSDPTFATPNYDIGYLWMNGTTYAGDYFYDPTQFISLGASLGSLTASFAGHTGDVLGGAGIIEGGTAIIPGTIDGQMITVELIAWYDPTGTTSFATAVANNYSVGGSILMPIRLAAGTDPDVADLRSFSGFPVGVPEPATFALAGLGGLGLWLLRRRQIQR